MIRSFIPGIIAGTAVTLGSIGFDKRFYPIIQTVPVAIGLHIANRVLGKPLEKIHDALNSPGSVLLEMISLAGEESLDLLDDLISEIYEE